MTDTCPYLSIVATTRNDDHGGGLNRRTEIFINGVAAQARRFELPTELILVEWNPPADRPPLREAFRWPASNPWCAVRIVTVPEALHRKYRYSDKLPLFQMIAKNVGVRRARGTYALTTNVDILFSDELFEFLAERRLEPEVLYRSDRVDVDRHVPLHAGIERQLQHCRSTVLRIARKEGMWVVPPSAPTRTVETARFVPHVAPELPVRRMRDMIPPRLKHAVRPGWNQGRRARAAALGVIRGRMVTSLRASVAGWFMRHRTTLEMFIDGPRGTEGGLLDGVARIVLAGLVLVEAVFRSTVRMVRALPRMVLHLPRTILGVLLRSPPGRLLRNVHHARATLRLLGYRPTLVELIDEMQTPRYARAMPYLHTNACGDFILAHRDTWERMRGSPELAMYSLHLDSLTLVTACKLGIRIEELPSHLVHYHVEHGNGWTPEQNIHLHLRMNKSGVRILTYGQYLRYGAYLLYMNDYFLSDHDWGLRDHELPETVVTHRVPNVLGSELAEGRALATAA